MSKSPRLSSPLRASANDYGFWKGTCQLGNLLVWGLALYLFWPAFQHVSNQAVIWHYSKGYLALIACLAALLLVWLSAVLVLSHSRQRFLFYITVVVFAGLECLFRLDVVQSRFTAIHHFRETAPYLAFSGTRDRFDPETADPSEFRIFMLGGSTVNTGNPSLPKALEDIFHAEGRPDVRVYNYGVVSFISRQELLMLMLDVLDKKPDLVIVYDGGNDIYQPYFGDPRPGCPYDWTTFEAGFALATNMADFRRTVSWALRKSALLRAMLDNVEFKEDLLRIKELRVQSGYGSPAWRRALAESWRSSWENMLFLTQGRNVPVACLLQPFLTEKTPLSETEKSIDARYDDAFREHMHEGYANMRAGVQSMSADAHGAVVADLSHALDGYPGQAFIDVIHVTDDANRYLARTVYDLVAPLVSKPPRSRVRQ